ncbi:MAG: preprotein translocase subunit SecY [Candidatus Altiarchaeales archaeon]|nr:preprotein translocase subunit SecY [Candidatus Altiarchaeales archaeon]MBD3415799.1 preprotein translocase subunit SecY [Candidatus Altiarchaeales archaeon]
MNLEFVRPFLRFLPEIKIPAGKVPFKEKLIWTSVVLILFYIMGNIYPYGVTRESLSEHISGFEQMTMIFASSIGSLTSVGIGPIVTASIILQLLTGAEMIDVDLKTKEGKALFQGAQKILTILIAFFEAGALVVATNMVEGTGLIAFTVFQIALGSILLMYMDEIVSKWGIGSGISLFIAGGVSQTIITGSFNPLKGVGGLRFAGYLPNFVDQMISGSMNIALIAPLIATVIVFIIVVYGESMRLEIPLAHGGVRGVGGRFPLKFFYVSNIPVILAAALLMNVRMWTSFVGVDIQSGMVPENMTVFQNIIYTIANYITMGNLYGILQPGNWHMLSDISIFIHLLIYIVVFCALCVLFGQFWVQTTGLDSESVAKQIQEYGMQIPGYRRDKRIVKNVLDRYIPQITIISSVAVGLVAAVADLMGALGSGTGILLTVGIIYRLYEEIRREQMADMSPMFRRFMGKA